MTITILRRVKRDPLRTKKQLDTAFEAALNDPLFAAWLLSQAKFRSKNAALVFEDLDDHTRFAFHIENKIASPFTWRQPEMYRERAQQWSGKSKWGSYTDYEVILIAPQEYHDRYQSECRKFDHFVPHEAIAKWLPAFRRH